MLRAQTRADRGAAAGGGAATPPLSPRGAAPDASVVGGLAAAAESSTSCYSKPAGSASPSSVLHGPGAAPGLQQEALEALKGLRLDDGALLDGGDGNGSASATGRLAFFANVAARMERQLQLLAVLERRAFDSGQRALCCRFLAAAEDLAAPEEFDLCWRLLLQWPGAVVGLPA